MEKRSLLQWPCVFGFVLCVCQASVGQQLYVPPDLYQDAPHETIGFWKELGQSRDTEGDTITSLRYYSKGAFPKIWMHDRSRVSFTMVRRNIAGLDTLHRMDMQPTGANAAFVDPVGVQVKGHYQNHYHAHCPQGITYVPGYERVVYPDIWPDIDLHFYSGSAGQKLAIVCKPGAQPEDVRLRFTGQDSLLVTLWGFLRLYYDERFIELPYAVAYQVDSLDNITPLGWSATFEPGEDEGIVKFNFGAFDTDKSLIFLVGPLPMQGGGTPQGLDWSTMVGTAYGFGSGDFFTAAARDGGDGIYVTGNTVDALYPPNTGVVFHAGSWDIIYGKFKHAPGVPAEDAALQWMTFFGGSVNDKARAIHYSNDDHLYIGGWTNSPDMAIIPVNDPQDGTYYQDWLKGSHDAVIVKCLPTNGEVLRTAYFGGEGIDMVTAITEDVVGSIFIGGVTTSTVGAYGDDCAPPAVGFPLCQTQAQSYIQVENAGGEDVFIARLDDQFRLRWSTFYGGAGDDHLLDADYLYVNPGVTPPMDRVGFVGTTTGSVPFGEGGTFQLAGNGQENGFIVTFLPDGELEWGTNLHGVMRLEAIAAFQDRFIVTGVTDHEPDIQNTCSAVAGELSICDPGNGAYQDDVVEGHDQYFAEFAIPDGTLLWSTCLGGLGDAGAVYDIPESGANLYLYWNYQPVMPPMKFSDLAVDAAGNLYGMGLLGYDWSFVNDHYPTQYAEGMYNQAWTPNTGDFQTDITLAWFSPQRGLLWSTLFGGGFEHVDTDVDYQYQHSGSDFGHSLLLYPGAHLYCVGSTGGVQFPSACPYPGTSWCEDPFEFIGGNGLDPFQAFVSRFILEDLNVGMGPFVHAGQEGTMLIFPNPSTDQLRVLFSGDLSNGLGLEAHVLDLHGKLVHRGRLQQPEGLLHVGHLTPGVYTLRLFATDGTPLSLARFAKH